METERQREKEIEQPVARNSIDWSDGNSLSCVLPKIMRVAFRNGVLTETAWEAAARRRETNVAIQENICDESMQFL